MSRARNVLVAVVALLAGGLAWGGGGVTGTGRFFGEVTDFASIYVNGIHFSIDTANIRIKGNDFQPESALKKGMSVRVEGTINPDGVTGTATLVEYLGDVEGKIDAAPVINGKSGSFSIYGLLIRTTESTRYDNVGGLSGLQAGNFVEVSGFFNANDGSFTATHLEKRSGFQGVDLRGFVSDFTPATSQFRLGPTLIVNYSGADIRDVPGGLANGKFVNVKAKFVQPVGGVLAAEDIRGEGSVLVSTALAAGIVEGVVANLNGTSMTMGNQPISFANAVFDGAPLSALVSGARAVASGPVTAGVLNAAAITIVPQLVSVASVKTHGPAGDLPLMVDPIADITGNLTVEPRVIGSGHKLVFTFTGPVTSLGYTGTTAIPNVTSRDATDAVDVGTVDSVVLSGNVVTVSLSGIPDNKRARIKLNNINVSGTDVGVSIGFLVGDVNASRVIDGADAAAARARTGQIADAGNFMFDLNLSGTINSAEIMAIKARSGTSLAP